MAKYRVFVAILLLLIFVTGIKRVDSKRQENRAGYHINHLREIVGNRYFDDDDDYDDDDDHVRTWTWVNSGRRRRFAYDPHTRRREYEEMHKRRKFGGVTGKHVNNYARRDGGHPSRGTVYGRKENENRMRMERNERLGREPERDIIHKGRRMDRGRLHTDTLQEDSKRHRDYPGRRNTRSLVRERNGVEEDKKRHDKVNRRKKEDGVDKKKTAKEKPARATDETKEGKKMRPDKKGKRKGNFKVKPKMRKDRPNKIGRKGRKHPKRNRNRQPEKKTKKKKRKEKGYRKFEGKFLNQTLFKRRKISTPEQDDSEKKTKRVKGNRKGLKDRKKVTRKNKKGKTKTVKPKPITKSQRVKIVIGNGLKAAAQRGNCSISHTIPINDGNAFVISGTNMLQGNSCNYNITAPLGSTVTVNCPVFKLYTKGCSKESIILTNEGTTTKYCGKNGPVNWVSSTNKVHILHRRSLAKKSKTRTGKKSGCSYSFICQVSITGSSETDKLVGLDSDCKQTFNMASGESAVVFSTNGQNKRNCTHAFKGPQGTLFNISCPFVDIGGIGYCDDSLKIMDTGAKSLDTLCKGTKSFPLETTLTHMVEFQHLRAKNKTNCAGGYLCKITVIGKAKWHVTLRMND